MLIFSHVATQNADRGFQFSYVEQRMPENTFSWWISIGSDNGLVPPGNQPLPEPMTTQMYVATWRHCMGHN